MSGDRRPAVSPEAALAAYAEAGSLRAAGELLGVSHATVAAALRRADRPPEEPRLPAARPRPRARVVVAAVTVADLEAAAITARSRLARGDLAGASIALDLVASRAAAVRATASTLHLET